MRVTLHNARVGKNGVFSAKHNDRNFNVNNTAHIDPDKSNGNFYWHCIPEHPEMSFDEVEEEFYKKHFSNHLNAQNQRYIAQRHVERCQTIDDMRKNPRTCPEEVLLQIGTVHNGITAHTLKDIALEYISWEKRIFPEISTLNIALHQDEQGGVHIHQRRVWIAHDKEGYEIVSQSKTLTEIGIQRPDPARPESRYNNKKQTFTRICREKFLEICKIHGLEIESEPREKSQSGLQLIDYKVRQEQQRMHQLKQRECELESKCLETEKALQEAGEFLHRAEMKRAFFILNRERERIR